MEHKGHIFKFWLQLVQNWRSLLKTSRNPEPGPGAHPDKTLNGHDLDEGVHTQTSSNNIRFRITQKKPPLGNMKWKVEQALKAGRTNILQVFQLVLSTAEQQGWNTPWNPSLNSLVRLQVVHCFKSSD